MDIRSEAPGVSAILDTFWEDNARTSFSHTFFRTKSPYGLHTFTFNFTDGTMTWKIKDRTFEHYLFRDEAPAIRGDQQAAVPSAPALKIPSNCPGKGCPKCDQHHDFQIHTEVGQICELVPCPG